MSSSWKHIPNVGSRAYKMAATVYKSGRVALTHAVHEQINSDYVELYYDEEKRLIGISPSGEDSETAYKLRNPKRSTSWVLSLINLINFYELEGIKGEKYQVEKQEDLFVINLNQPITSKKKKAASV